MKTYLNKTIYIDALALVPKKKSGVGLTLKQTLEQLAVKPELKDFTIYLVVPLGKAKQLEKYLSENVKTKTIFLPARVFGVLLRIGLLPPMDWFLGRGIYIFPNYRNWPLWYSRSITYIYDLGYLLYPETLQVKNLNYLKKNIDLWARRTDVVVAISSQIHDEIAKHLSVPYNKISIVYCGVDKKLFHRRGQAEIEDVKKKYGIKLKDYLLCVGNIEPRKNIIRLIDAYTLLPEEIQNRYALILIGADGWLNQEINDHIDQAKDQGKNILKTKDYVSSEDLPALYSGASLLVQPAIYEGFGIPPLEAMACETAVAVSDIDSIKEVVQDSGHYFNPLSTASISSAIVESLNENQVVKASRLQRGLLRASELSWSSSAQSLSAIIQRVYDEGVHRKPLLRRGYYIYKQMDTALRKLCGESNLEPYVPHETSSVKELKEAIYDDFLKEQPSSLQSLSLKLYLKSRHVVAYSLKTTLRRLRMEAR